MTSIPDMLEAASAAVKETRNSNKMLYAPWDTNISRVCGEIDALISSIRVKHPHVGEKWALVPLDMVRK
jgi:hypothetical protein